jgi:hypothetical protein
MEEFTAMIKKILLYCSIFEENAYNFGNIGIDGRLILRWI